jgi:hypothetical protein|tara:strand:+ start:904 stop:1569 length:666 start_codon:yes stop_codon:yes gene_type:complete
LENKYLPLPDQKNYESANNLAYQLACQQLANIDDLEAQCRKNGAQYRTSDSQKSITVQYLNQTYFITLPDVTISSLDSPEVTPVRDRILILHYLLTAKGTPLTKRLIAFHELPEGNVYYPTFVKRTSQSLTNSFGSNPHLLLETGRKLGGQKAPYGDMAVTINAFTHVPITIVLWGGDDEFPPQVNVLFDATISHYLPTEDITVLCETISRRLIRLKRPAS